MIKRILPSMFLILFVMGCSTRAQLVDQEGRSITINMSASEMLPADLIVFNINVNAEGGNPQQAFQLHKQRESLLADLLKEFNLQEKDIRFQPIQISRSYNNQREEVVRTSQQVSVSFSDFGIYEQIQLTLIENSFDSFSGSFSSSEMEAGKEKALVAAINAATDKARLIANTSGVSLGSIQQINYSEYQVSTGYRAESMVMKAADSSMMDFAQTVEVTANITIRFSISD